MEEGRREGQEESGALWGWRRAATTRIHAAPPDPWREGQGEAGAP
jgi:hypothetical protein